uniref:Uncharacterized protein n=1 Tax=viral metagenome TaxID=1070528 RepID=A0A6M3J237_9ZZZZ
MTRINNALIMGALKFGGKAREEVVVYNSSGGDLVAGDVVVLDTTNSTATLTAVTTTTTQDDLTVFGMLLEAISSANYGRCLVKGLTNLLKVDGTTDIAVGNHISTFTTAGIAAKATANKGGAFAIALEAYATNDSSGVIDAYLTGSAGRFDGAAASSLDDAYNGGAAITVDAAAVTLTGSHASNNTLAVTATGGTGNCIDITQAGTGYDIQGTGDTWEISKAGAIDAASLTLAGDITMIGATGTHDIVLADSVADALSIKRNTTDMIVFDSSTPRVTITPATTITGALTLSGGAAITGNSSVTGTFGVTGNTTLTGTLSVTGDVDWGGSLTTDELILDTDGVQPAGTLAWVVSDNSGDLTINALSTKSVLISIAKNDEYTFNATALQMGSANNLQFMGNNGILDSGGNELIQFTATGSAVNYLQVINAAAADPITLQCLGTADRGFVFEAVDGEEMLELGAVTDAIDYIKIISAAGGTNAPTIQSAGDTANLGIDFENSEGEEMLQLVSAATSVNHVVITSVAGATTHPIISCSTEDVGIMFTDGSGTKEEILNLEAVASATVYLQISSATTGAPPVISSAGEENIGIDFENSEGEEMLQLVSAATSVNHVVITSVAGATNPPIISSNVADYGILFTDGSGTKEEILLLAGAADAITYLKIISAATATAPVIQTAGEADIGLDFETSEGEEMLQLAAVANAVENVKITSAIAAGGPIIASVTSATNAGLRIDTAGTGNIILMVGGDEILAISDLAITLAAATDTAGHALYMQTEDGGVDGGAGTGRAGGALEVRTGDGSASTTAAQVGGAGGAMTLVTGAGLTGNTTGNGGVGGAFAITAGAGGDSGAGAGVGGTGGSITLTAGAGGGAGGGTAGAPGRVSIGAGTFTVKVQTIDMANAAVSLTMVPGTPTGTLLAGNILYADANSGDTENLLLPHEADCTGMLLTIINTGGETINLQNDAGGALLTIATAETGVIACDGTTWRGYVGVV